MNILVLNSGSSSIKFQLFGMDGEERLLVKGIADKIGLEDSFLRTEGRGCRTAGRWPLPTIARP